MELSTAIHLLGDILGNVIAELESPEIFAIEERIRAAAKDRRGGNVEAADQLKVEIEALDANAARAVSSAFASYFDLVNLAEENQRTQQLVEREKKLHPVPIHESVSEAVALLKQEGVTPEQMQSLLDDLSIELVLTAHPTESRRRTIISKLQRIAQMLDDLSSVKSFRRARRKKFTRKFKPRLPHYGLPTVIARRALPPPMKFAQDYISSNLFFGMPCLKFTTISTTPLPCIIPELFPPPAGFILLHGWAATATAIHTSRTRSRRKPCACIADLLWKATARPCRDLRAA